MTSAREATSRLVDLLRREHLALAEFLVELAAFDEGRRWAELGYASLFDFLRRELGLSKASAFYRLTAARLIRRHPEVVVPLRDGRLCFTSVVELSKVLTAENLHEVLPRFFHLSKREARDVLAELAPEPVVPRRTVVTAAPVPAAPPLSLASAPPPAGELTPPVVHPGEPPAPAARLLTVEPRTADLSRLHLTVSRGFLAKLAAARDVLSHSHPGACEDAILELGLDLILERYARRRGLGAKPRKRSSEKVSPPPAAPPAPPRRSRHVPAHVWRAVWARDSGRCAWPLENGGVCGSTHRLEVDHVRGFALGAGTTTDECRLLCRRHQDVAARSLYGDAVVDRYARPGSGRCAEPVAVYAAAPAQPAPAAVAARAGAAPSPRQSVHVTRPAPAQAGHGPSPPRSPPRQASQDTVPWPVHQVPRPRSTAAPPCPAARAPGSSGARGS